MMEIIIWILIAIKWVLIAINIILINYFSYKIGYFKGRKEQLIKSTKDLESINKQLSTLNFIVTKSNNEKYYN